MSRISRLSKVWLVSAAVLDYIYSKVIDENDLCRNLTRISVYQVLTLLRAVTVTSHANSDLASRRQFLVIVAAPSRNSAHGRERSDL